MLVCAFVDAFGTRDRGCSAHPVFPAPSDYRGQGNVPAKLGRTTPRERELMLGCHRPPPGLAFGEPDDRLQRTIRHPGDIGDRIETPRRTEPPAFAGDDSYCRRAPATADRRPPPRRWCRAGGTP